MDSSNFHRHPGERAKTPVTGLQAETESETLQATAEAAKSLIRRLRAFWSTKPSRAHASNHRQRQIPPSHRARNSGSSSGQAASAAQEHSAHHRQPAARRPRHKQPASAAAAPHPVRSRSARSCLCPASPASPPRQIRLGVATVVPLKHLCRVRVNWASNRQYGQPRSWERRPRVERVVAAG